MYALYDKARNKGATQYRFQEQVSLFGCNEGYIPWLLSKQLTSDSSEPFPWHVNIEDCLKGVEQDNQTLIIDLKPNNRYLSLYEVLNVWGYSASGWTPILLHLRSLFIDENRGLYNDKDFIRTPEEVDEPIFSMLYLNGTIKGGQLEGKWTTPGPGATNSVLLWPDVFKYFWQQAKNIIDGVV